MRITYRNHDIKNYWTSRWNNIPVDNPMQNTNVYPLKYSEKIINDRRGKILEAGCGVGRIQRFYHNQGVDIVGIDFIKIAIEKLKKIDSTLKVEVGDITNLRFDSESFKYILAFGLFHNLEHGLEKAINETYRILEKDGAVCASFRSDNIGTKISDWLTNRKSNKANNLGKRVFHKMNLTRAELKQVFEKSGFNVKSIDAVENMPILYRFRFFRSLRHKRFDENIAREEGYQLSAFGQLFQNFLMRFLPNEFCNVYVLIAYKI
ncbi:class I SAM-dependent methyltransferase [Methylophilaceae bacterium Uisw_099_01]